MEDVLRDREWIPTGVPLDRPSPARIYDYMLGGYHNFEIDREMADATERLYPYIRLSAQANRAFLRRAVTLLTREGCDQFLDIGSGIPTAGNVHEVAHSLNPEARVVYVDIDPVAVAHGQEILAGNPHAAAIRADIRTPAEILSHPEVQRLLDFDRPVALMMVTVLHYVLDDQQAQEAVKTLRTAVAPGSYLAISHSIPRQDPQEVEAAFRELVRRGTQMRDRDPDDILDFFGDWLLVPPGLVLTPLWRPEGPTDLLLDDPERGWAVAGVARK